MSGCILRGTELRDDLTLRADVVVCGGGAGGCMVAAELARAGMRVVVFEEGGDHVGTSFTQREDTMIPELFAELGGRRTDDLAVLVLTGRGLGGSTLHNTNLCKRAPPEILERWRVDHGLTTIDDAAFDALYDSVERDLGVVPIEPRRINAANALVQRGIERLGWRGGLLRHNRDARCIGSGFCELGCTYDGKLNARRVLVPRAVDAGATFVVRTEVERVEVRRGELREVRARAARESGGARLRGPRVSVPSPRAVVLAGGAVGSPALALRSEVHDPYRRLGASLRLHPAAVAVGVFDEPVAAWRGIPQSVECTEFLDFSPGSERRVWIVPSFAHPAGAAALTPGFGPALMRSMRDYPRTVGLAAMVHDEAEGRVYLDGDDRVRLSYAPTGGDRAQLALGLRACARILLAAGARAVTIPAVPPIVVRTEGEIEAMITAARCVPHDVGLTAVHPMGAMRMGADPATSVVDARGRHHHVRGLYVADAGLMPTSLGGPPQLTVYALARLVARAILDDLRPG
jgi:choline dehydrogenase-like flavoprotein